MLLGRDFNQIAIRSIDNDTPACQIRGFKHPTRLGKSPTLLSVRSVSISHQTWASVRNHVIRPGTNQFMELRLAEGSTSGTPVQFNTTIPSGMQELVAIPSDSIRLQDSAIWVCVHNISSITIVDIPANTHLVASTLN